MVDVPKVESLKTKAERSPSSFLGVAHLPMLLVALLLVVYGLVVLYFVTINSLDYSITKQIIGVCIGLVLMSFFWWFDYKKLADASTVLFIISIVLILSPHLPVIGRSIGGAQAWLNIGGQTLQPGEFAKIVTILTMASAVARYQGRIDKKSEYIRCLVLLFLPFLCIMTQPDLGTGIVLLVIGFSILLIGGVNRRLIFLSLLIMVALIALIFISDLIVDGLAGSDMFIKQYQKDRLIVFIDPSVDPKGIGYNMEQARIAIGSGGLFGKGLGLATQSSMGFLPAAATDFIFCTIAEQLGFVGCMILFALFITLFAIIISMARRVEDLFGKLILAGVLGMWLFQVFENVGMSCGALPVTGIPLPFFSYGSSMMIVNLVSLGLVSSVWKGHLKDKTEKIN